MTIVQIQSLNPQSVMMMTCHRLFKVSVAIDMDISEKIIQLQCLYGIFIV